jgi:hypothetical protein
VIKDKRNQVHCDEEPCGAVLTLPVEKLPNGFARGTIEEQTERYAEANHWLVVQDHDRGRGLNHHFCSDHTECTMAKYLPTARRHKVDLAYRHSSPSGRSLIASKDAKATTVTSDLDIAGL